MAFDGRPGEAEVPRGGRRLEQASALAQDVFEERVEPVDVPETEEALNVPRKERIQPFPVERRRLGMRENGRRQPASEEPVVQRRAEGTKLVPQHGKQMNRSLPPGQRVAELPTGGERRRAGRQDLHLRESVGANLEDAGRVSELVNLVEHHHRPVDRAEEDLRVANHVLRGRQVAVHVEHPLGAEALGKRGLPAAADSAEPDNRRLAPGVLDSTLPEGTLNHATVLYIKAYQMYSMVARRGYPNVAFTWSIRSRISLANASLSSGDAL